MAAFSYTAPLFTKEKEAIERANATKEERDAAAKDVYGDEFVEETEKMVSDSLALFVEELEAIPNEEKEMYLQALKRCPIIVEQESDPIRFLRAEDYDAQKAAVRLAKYWEARVDLFGEDRAFLRMALDGVMAADARLFQELGDANHMLPRDERGRAVYFTDKNRSTNERLSNSEQLRLFWYQVHAELEDASVQQKGFIMLGNVKMTKLSHFNRAFTRAEFVHIRQILPMKLRAMHGCNPPSLVSQLILPAVKLLIGKSLRLRCIMHAPSNLPQALLKYGLKEEHIPASVGGTHHFSLAEWLEFRRELESSR
eukprot:CAMPEP_0119014106 /NCGR_PEP_ID=MMETSP1176-20130426/9357_1 /TAXON_ID=265551 /ORGANISM="Synedropsis recta cf, Strain CCMP1620" /LENGTH=311 /DNA_ID=CAMNT_0006967245 /DNA_START=25 /DNA_END=960 /DNA_ORIENTATION=-